MIENKDNLIVAGEIYLRNFSFYGIEYFIQLDEKRIKKAGHRIAAETIVKELKW